MTSGSISGSGTRRAKVPSAARVDRSGGPCRSAISSAGRGTGVSSSR